MTTEPRRFRVILDTCDIVRSEPKREEWPETEAPKHSIFDQRHLSVHQPLTLEGRIRRPSKLKEELPPKVQEESIPKPPKTYPYRRLQEHKSHGDPCTLCGQSAAEHRPNREAVKKEREGK